MRGNTRSKSAWALGFLIPALFFLSSGSRVLSTLEGQVLALASSFVVPVTSRNPVTVVALGPDATAATFTALMGHLKSARAIGLVPPLPLPILGSTPVSTRVPLVQGALPRASVLPAPLPPGIKFWSSGQMHDATPYVFVPGLLTGAPDGPNRIDMIPVPVSPGHAAVLDFTPGFVSVYRAPLVVRTRGSWTPSFALRLASLATGAEIPPSSLRPGSIRLPLGLIRTDTAYRVYPRPLSGTIPQVSTEEVLAGRFNAAGKVVLIGVSKPDVEPVVFSGGGALAPVVAEARLTAALLERALYTVPPWGVWAVVGAFLFVALVLAVVLPRLSAVAGLLLVLLIAFVALTGELGLLSLRAIFLPMTAPVLALVGGNLALLFRKRSEARWLAAHEELDAANRLLGQAYQTQGQLDNALERYRRCNTDEDLLERLYTLGLDFERRRQFGKAAATFALIVGSAHKFRDSRERLQRNRDADGQVLFGKPGAAASPTGTLIMSNPGLARPTLGRYEVERELGHGAMGAVYLGRDPRIGRTVAIKTVALTQEFEGEGLIAVRERFFREAETAGRLAHPNIVTIYDVGEEEDLAYIAMDYLKGQSLADYVRSDGLLPVREVMTVIVQVAEALDYAHGRKVVHRDIKPANIIYDREEGAAKVTDFGVACLTDTSKTRTGTVLGSPSYMSPEQVAGKKVDGRTDLFSLGVTLFQLLTGELPFKGDSMASLMYRISNDKPADIRKLRKDLPNCLARIVTKALQKEPEKRYQRGSDMAAALRRCQEDVED